MGLRCVWELAKYKDAGGSLRTAIHKGGRRRCMFPPGALSYLVMFGKWTWDACRSCCNKCGYCRDEEWLFAPTVLLLLPLKRSELDFNRDPQSHPLSFILLPFWAFLFCSFLLLVFSISFLSCHFPPFYCYLCYTLLLCPKNANIKMCKCNRSIVIQGNRKWQEHTCGFELCQVRNWNGDF